MKKRITYRLPGLSGMGLTEDQLCIIYQVPLQKRTERQDLRRKACL